MKLTESEHKKLYSKRDENRLFFFELKQDCLTFPTEDEIASLKQYHFQLQWMLINEKQPSQMVAQALFDEVVRVEKFLKKSVINYKEEI